jgi:predicted metal-binding transcription factor (methanogenesis marker protein 9)
MTRQKSGSGHGRHSAGILRALDDAAQQTQTAEAQQYPLLAEMDQQAAKKRSHHKKKTLVADEASTCFSEMRWQDGIAYATFARDGYQIELEMTKQEFQEWENCGSLGSYYNGVLA